jgi:hypothetical protein
MTIVVILRKNIRQKRQFIKAVDSVMIINNAIAIAMVIIKFSLAAYKEDSLLYHCNCKGHKTFKVK